MIRRGFALLMVVLIASSNLFAQTTPISNEDYLSLLTLLRFSKERLEALDNEVIILKENLRQAENSLNNSERIIEDLQGRLQAALRERDELAILVTNLERQLTELSKSLEDTKQQMAENEQRHTDEIQDLADSYEKQMEVYRILLIIGGTLIVGGGVTIYIMAQ
jgi:chromosome segregation ATPase